MPRKSEPSLRNQIRILRTQSTSMTQQDLADRLGVTRQTVIALEREGYTPSLALALRIAETFQTPVEKLFWFEDVD